MPQGPNYGLQGGSVWVVGASGTLDAGAAGSVSMPASVMFTNGTVASFRANDGTFVGTITIGGTVGRWAFGSAALDTGTALVYTGLTTIVSVSATPLKTSPGTATTAPSSFQIDPSRFANGTFYALGLAGTFNYAGGGTLTWQAFGY